MPQRAKFRPVSAQDEKEIQEAVQGFVTDPFGFVLWVFPWGQGALKGKYPDKWQIEILEDIRDGVEFDIEANQQHARSSGHGIGKTALVAWIILWSMSVRPDLAGVVTANTQKQLTSKTWRELSIWHQRMINGHWFEWTATRFQHIVHKETWGVDAIPWTEHNSESFAGLHGKYVLVVYDEASAIVNKIWEVTEGALTTTRCMWFVFGNPTRPTGRFRSCFGKNRHRWQTAKIDSRTCAMTNKEKIAQWEEDHEEDSDFMRVRVRGEFPRKGTSSLISTDDVASGRKNDIPPEEYIYFPKVFGVDVARFGGDESVITFRQGRKVHWQEPHVGLNTMQLASRVNRHWINEGRTGTVFVEVNGMGAGVVDRLRQLGVRVIEVDVGSKATEKNLFYNVRSEMWNTMSEWMEMAVDLPDCSILEEQLTLIEYSYDRAERMQMERKEEFIKREPDIGSPDRADSLALTFSYPVSATQDMDSMEPEVEESY